MEWRTVEVRWFLAGPCPEDVIEWFHAGDRVGEPERRADEYALLARDDLGIKRRGADVLDIKVRTAQLDSVSLPDGLVGRVEAWTKWSVPLGASGALPMESVVVSKTRWSRRYELTADTTTRPIALTQLVSVGCAAELAFLRIGSVRAWSFGFEAFNREGDALDAMIVGAQALVTETPLGTILFGAENSSGYPAWLRRFE